MAKGHPDHPVPVEVRRKVANILDELHTMLAEPSRRRHAPMLVSYLQRAHEAAEAIVSTFDTRMIETSAIDALCLDELDDDEQSS